MSMSGPEDGSEPPGRPVRGLLQALSRFVEEFYLALGRSIRRTIPLYTTLTLGFFGILLVVGAAAIIDVLSRGKLDEVLRTIASDVRKDLAGSSLQILASAAVIFVTAAATIFTSRTLASSEESLIGSRTNYNRLLSELSRAERRRRRLVDREAAAVQPELKPREDAEVGKPESWLDILAQFRLRMGEEGARLRTNSRVNLIWGLAFSILALGSLVLSAIFFPPARPSSTLELVSTYGPRAAMALILELVSFFFLRLYGTNEQELKHHKNEVTNMESKFAGAMLAESRGQDSTIAASVSALVAVERNFVLKKGETTVVTEVDTRYNDLQQTISELAKLIKLSK